MKGLGFAGAARGAPGCGVHPERAPRAQPAREGLSSASLSLPEKGKMSFLEEKHLPELSVQRGLSAAAPGLGAEGLQDYFHHLPSRPQRTSLRR